MAGHLARRVLDKKPHERHREKSRIHVEHHQAVGTWTAESGGVVYTLSLPQGAHVDGRGLLCVPEIACDPAPPKPMSPPFYFGSPPLQVRDASGELREDPVAALQEIVTAAALGH